MSARATSGLYDVRLSSEAETARLARDIAAIARPGDIVALSGGLGAGKSTFARAFIRHLAGDPALDVPSPTFTLLQTYPTASGLLVHADLYRIRDASELPEIGLLDTLDEAITLVEWPERGDTFLSGARRLDLAFELTGDGEDQARRLHMIAGADWAQRLDLALGTRRLIDKAGWGEARRDFMQGDASARAYERLVAADGQTAILMISPPRPDGPAVRGGKPYSAIAKLAENVHAFVAMDRGLRALNFSAPEILAQDLDLGLLLTEDLGPEQVVNADGPIPERYEAAACLLASMHGHKLPTILPVSDTRDHVIPDYDATALAIETELLLDWYSSHIAGVALPAVARSRFEKIWAGLIEDITSQPPTWVLRDFHSPNLIWLEAREGHCKLGLIDFQDAVIGHPAYDLVSLGQDARVTVPPDLELRLLGAYAKARRANDPDFDLAAFARGYAILGAQRNTKIAGIFARLDKRDGKPAYLKHLPRVETYLRRNLEHPAVAELKQWHIEWLPKMFEAQ